MGILSKLAQLLSKRGAEVPAEALTGRYAVKAEGPARSAEAFTAADKARLQDLLAEFARPKRLTPDQSHIFAQAMKKAEKPDVTTHVLYDAQNSPIGLYQLTGQHGLDMPGNYLPNLVSLNGPGGVGRQALQEARRSGPFGLVTTPESEKFYERMIIDQLPGFMHHPDPDLRGSAYINRRKGGLVQMKECNRG